MNPLNAHAPSVDDDHDIPIQGRWPSHDGIQLLPSREMTPVASDTAQEAIHEVMTRHSAEELTSAREQTERYAPAGASTTSSVKSLTLRTGRSVKSERWKRQLPAAKMTWDKLIDDELVGSRGRRCELSDLLHSKYSMTRAEADMQVRRFLQQHAD
jgi:hypothetical protein